MNIYIPEHLKKLPIMDQLYQMIKQYSYYYDNKEESSFDDFNSYRSTDAVKRFLYLILKDNDSIDLDNVVNYLSTLFYSAKGTDKVFELLMRYCGIESYLYTTEYLEIIFPKDYDYGTSNLTLFDEIFKDFIDSLVYYKKLRTNANPANMVLDSTFEVSVDGNAEIYKQFDLEEI